MSVLINKKINIREKYKNICAEFKKMDKHYKKIINNLKKASVSKSSNFDKTRQLIDRQANQHQEEVQTLRDQLEKITTGISPIQEHIESRINQLSDLIGQKEELNNLEQGIQEGTHRLKEYRMEGARLFAQGNFNEDKLLEVKNLESEIAELLKSKEFISKNVHELDDSNSYDPSDLNMQLIIDFEQIIIKNSEFSPLKQFNQTLEFEKKTLNDTNYYSNEPLDFFSNTLGDESGSESESESEMQSVIENLTDNNTHLTNEIVILKEENENLKNIVEKTEENENTHLVVSDNNHEKTMQDLNQCLIEVTNELEATNLKLNELTGKNIELITKYKNLETKNCNTETEKKNLERTLRSQLLVHENKITDLVSQLNEYENPSDLESSFDVEETITED